MIIRSVPKTPTPAVPSTKLPDDGKGGAASAEPGVTVTSQIKASSQGGIDGEVTTTLDFTSAAPKEYPQSLPPSAGGVEAFWIQVEFEAPEGATKNRTNLNSGGYQAVAQNDTLNSKPGKTGLRWWLNGLKYKLHPETKNKVVVEWQKEDGSVVSTIEYSVVVTRIQISPKEVTASALSVEGTNLKLAFAAALPARVSATVVCSSEKKEDSAPGEDVTAQITETDTQDGKTKEYTLSTSADGDVYKYKLKSVTSEYISVSSTDGIETISTPLRKVAKRSKKKTEDEPKKPEEEETNQ